MLTFSDNVDDFNLTVISGNRKNVGDIIPGHGTYRRLWYVYPFGLIYFKQDIFLTRNAPRGGFRCMFELDGKY